MKKILSFLCLALICCMIFPTLVMSENAITSDKPVKIDAYPADNACSDLNVGEGMTYGVRLGLNAPFRGFSIRLSTYLKTDSQATLSVYKWNGNYDDTIAAKPLASAFLETVRDNQKHDCTFDNELPAGEYLFTVKNERSQICVWRWKDNTVSLGFGYADGIEAKGDINLTIFFTKTPETPFYAVKSTSEITGNNTAPAEAVPAADSALVLRDAKSSTWVATDELRRTLPTYAEVGGEREDRTVALFYWSWHTSQDSGEPLNVQKFIEEHPDAAHDYKNAAWPKTATVHFWNESVFGFYKTNDKWVIRKHAEMLADAGVDVIFFDNTNGTFTFRDSYIPIYQAFSEARADGVDTPKISFLFPFGNDANNNTLVQLSSIYQDIYLQEKYQDLWFYWDGKPMVMGHKTFITGNSDIAKEMRNYFTFRGGQPGYLVGSTTVDTWGWLSTYPQALYYKRGDKKTVEQMTVGVAVNHNSKTKQITAMNGENVIGRTYTSKGVDTREMAVCYGANFAEQFDYALKVDPRVIFITGWNEWIAGRYEQWPDSGSVVKNAFPDEYNDEFSRDLEPSKGQLRDNYYYQMVSYIRKYKGCEEPEQASAKTAISLTGGTEQWSDVGPYYIAYKNNVSDRDADGYGSTYYKDESGRNDFIGAKVARTDNYIYFNVECNNDITPYTDPLWMNLYIDCAEAWGWESFDYVLNKTAPGADSAVLERFTGDGYNTEKVGDVSYSVSGNTMTVCIPKASLGITGDDYTLNFKWTDNVQADDGSGTFVGEILDFYRTGDVAPGGRYKYSFVSTVANSGASVTEPSAPTTEPQTNTPGGTSEPKDTDKPSGNTDGAPDIKIIIIICAGVVLVAAVAVIIIVKRKK